VFRGPTFEGRGQKEKGGEGKQGVHFCPRKKKKEKLAPTHKTPGIWWHTVANLHPIHNTT